MSFPLQLLSLALGLLTSTMAYAVNITVNPGSVIRTTAQTPYGVGFNQINDGTLSLQSLKNVVIQSGAKHLRFPEGESADNYYFTDPTTLANPNPATARVANTSNWPGGTTLTNTNGTFPKGLNFDQFMSVVTAAGAKANVVLCYPCGDKAQALEMAKAWVKYSKDMGYNVTHWEIGNETYLYNPNYTDTYAMTAEEYANDIIVWATALKAIDPNIKIGVNGKTRAWINTLLTFRHTALNKYGAEVIDFLAVHLYPMYNSNFAAYQQNQNAYGTLNFMSDVQPALDALNDSLSTSDTSHITIAITECSTMNYSTTSDPNNMGSAIMTADLLTEVLKHPRIEYIELWASRWIKNFSSSTPQGSDTFSSQNNLNPSGLALSALTAFTRDKVVSVSGATTSLKAFASVSSTTGDVSVILINRSNSTQSVSLAVTGASTLTGRRHSFTASSATSTSPTFSTVGVAVSSSTSSLSVSVPKTSFLILNLTGISTTPPPVATNLILNPGFESLVANWTDWGNSAALTSNVFSGSYSLQVGKGTGGRMQTVSGVTPTTAYKFTAKAKVGSSSENAWLGVTFYDANGAKIAGADHTVAVTSTSYQTHTMNFTAPAVFSSVQVWVWKDNGSSYLYVDDLALVVN